MLAEEADVLVAPEISTQLKAKFKAARPVLRRAEWLQQLWDDRYVEAQSDATTPNPKKKASLKDRSVLSLSMSCLCTLNCQYGADAA